MEITLATTLPRQAFRVRIADRRLHRRSTDGAPWQCRHQPLLHAMNPRLFPIGLAVSAASAFAQTQSMQPPKQDVWTIGAGVVTAPRSPGSRTNRIIPFPVVTARLASGLFFDPIRGLGYERQLVPGLFGSVSLGAELSSRRVKDEPRLRGLDTVTEAFALRAGVVYESGRFSTDTRLAVRLGSDHKRGTILSQDLSYAAVAGPWGAFNVGVTADVGDRRYLQNLFGVTATEAAASGLRPYRPSGGIVAAGPFAQTLYRLSEDWTFFARGGVNTLVGDAADSPIVSRKLQPYAIATVSRRF